MSEENQVQSSGPSVDLASQERQAKIENAKAQAERIQDRKERVSDVIDSVWSETPKGAEEASHASEEESSTFETDQQRTEEPQQQQQQEQSERTQKDVVDELWDDEFSQHDEELAQENDESSAHDDENAQEIDGEGDDEQSFSEDELLLSRTLEDGTEEQYGIPKDAKITVKVDGEDQQISIQDFANGISGQKAIAQKFSALASEKQAFEARVQGWQESQKKATELLGQNKAVEAIQHVAESMGQDPQALFTNLFEEITPVLDQYANLDEASRQAWVQELRNKRAEYQARSAQSELERLQTYQEQQAKVRATQEAYGMNDATFMQMYQDLEQEMRQGSIKNQPMSAELVGQYYKLRTHEAYAESALKGTPLEGNRESIDQVLAAVNQMERFGNVVSEESVKALVSEALSQKQHVEKSKKVNKSLKKKGVKPSPNKGQGTVGQQVNRQSDAPASNNWMERALNDLDGGKSAAELGLMSTKHNSINNGNKQKRKR